MEIISPDGQTARIPLNKARLVLGRSSTSSDIVLSDARVSRVHAQILCEAGDVTITDLRSANGTRLDHYLLPPNVPISWMIDQTAIIGDTKMTLREGTPVK
jgi:pSer/pThr/pTyr-binding forkhead associated (FHA) protein